jgi:hypothetical protein
VLIGYFLSSEQNSGPDLAGFFEPHEHGIIGRYPSGTAAGGNRGHAVTGR